MLENCVISNVDDLDALSGDRSGFHGLRQPYPATWVHQFEIVQRERATVSFCDDATTTRPAANRSSRGRDAGRIRARDEAQVSGPHYTVRVEVARRQGA